MTHTTATPAQWVAGARPRTLPAAVAPVAAGTGAAFALDGGSWPRAALALVVALALQVGVNYANDYSDGIRGTDADRVGPVRLVGSGAASAAAVRAAALLAFAVAGVAGVALVALSGQRWLLAVGAACVVAAWYYTGGRSPYGYRGLGEVFVFVFFGLVAVTGTTYTQAGSVSWASWAAACGVGALICDVLVANNLRDVPTDRVAGKRTLAVRLGQPRTRVLYVALLAVGFVAVAVAAAAAGSWWPLLGMLALPLAVGPARQVLAGADGAALVPVLGATGKVVLVHGVLLGVGLALA